MHLKVMDTVRASTMFSIATSPPGSPRCIADAYKDAYQMFKPEAYIYKLKRMWILVHSKLILNAFEMDE